MKILTFEGTSIGELDKRLNDFEDNNNVKATQTRTVWDGKEVRHFYTVFYIPNDKEEVVKVEVQKVK